MTRDCLRWGGLLALVLTAQSWFTLVCAEPPGAAGTVRAYSVQRLALTPPDPEQPVPYLLLRPPGAEAGQPAPLLIFLYGAGGSIDDYNLQRPPYDRLRELLAARRYFILIPELGPDHFMNERARISLDAILSEVRTDHPIDPGAGLAIPAAMAGTF